MFHIASENEIKEGKVTDVYFKRTEEILKKKRIKRKVAMEVVAHNFPVDYPWTILAGVEEVVELGAEPELEVSSEPASVEMPEHIKERYLQLYDLIMQKKLAVVE